MGGPDAADSWAAQPSVFLSYASEDRSAARLLRDALPAYGLEVWYDESDLDGGDAWDRKIRRQIRDCDYFMPLVSAQTERRHEGYFRREWRLAVERTLDMADDHLYLLPVVIDAIEQSGARVPEKFLSVQWLKVPGGLPTPALESMCRRLAKGAGRDSHRAPKSTAADRQNRSTAAAATNSEFPSEQNGEKVRFWFEVAGWAGRAAWRKFKRLPRWIRAVAYVWLCIALLSRCNSSPPHPAADSSSAVTPAKVEKLKTIARQNHGDRDKNDITRLASSIAKEFASDDDEPPTTARPLLAIAFTAPPGDASAARLADSAFAMTYGMIEISRHGQVGLTKEPLVSEDLGAAVARGRAAHAAYVLVGSVEPPDGLHPNRAHSLTLKIVKVADAAVAWSKTYDAAGADPARIAADVDAHLPELKAPEAGTDAAD